MKIMFCSFIMKMKPELEGIFVACFFVIIYSHLFLLLSTFSDTHIHTLDL